MARCAGCSGLAYDVQGFVSECVAITVDGEGPEADPYIISADLLFAPDTEDCINCGAEGLGLILDPDGGLVCGVDGLGVDGGAPLAAVSTTDSASVDLSGDGTPGDPLIAAVIGGPFLATVTTTDSASVDFSGAGTPGSPLTAAVIGGAFHTHDGSGGATSLIVGGLSESGASAPTSTSLQSVAIGDYSNAGTGTQPIAIGSGTNATSAPSATGQGGIAIGSSNGAAIAGARASGANSVAIGSGDAVTAGASATHSNSVAVGKGSVTAAADQIMLGTSAHSVKIPGTLTDGKGYVNHGAVDTTPRPSGFVSIEWYGTVAPLNAITGDTWVDTT